MTLKKTLKLSFLSNGKLQNGYLKACIFSQACTTIKVLPFLKRGIFETEVNCASLSNLVKLRVVKLFFAFRERSGKIQKGIDRIIHGPSHTMH